MKSILITFFAIFLVQLTDARVQRVNVSGTILCGGQRVMKMVVEMWEFDRTTADDFLNATQTNEQGEFSMTGEHDEIFSIEPYLQITHECGAKKGCVKQAYYYVPTSKIDEDYDMNFIALDIYTNDEKTLCGNKIPTGYEKYLATVEMKSE